MPKICLNDPCHYEYSVLCPMDWIKLLFTLYWKCWCCGCETDSWDKRCTQCRYPRDGSCIFFNREGCVGPFEEKVEELLEDGEIDEAEK